MDTTKFKFDTSCSFKKETDNLFRVCAPFFHDDGDMIDMFIEERDDSFYLTDMGTALMRLSYYIDLDTESKLEIFNNILILNNIENKKGKLELKTSPQTFGEDLNTFYLTIAKITSMDMLSKSNVKTLFADLLDEYLVNEVGKKYEIVKKFRPLKESDIIVEYKIEVKGFNIPFYIFPVKTSLQALRSACDCSELEKNNVKSINIAVCEDSTKIDKQDYRRMNNQMNKCFTDRSSFEENLDKTFDNYVNIANG